MPNSNGIDKGLTDAAKLASKTAHAERTIMGAAETRLAALEKELDDLLPYIYADSDKAQRYMDLVAERGTLQAVLANSKAALGA